MLEKFIGGFIILLLVSLCVFGFYSLIWGPDGHYTEKVDDQCVLVVNHDRRLFEADKPETRTVYCKKEG